MGKNRGRLWASATLIALALAGCSSSDAEALLGDNNSPSAAQPTSQPLQTTRVPGQTEGQGEAQTGMQPIRQQATDVPAEINAQLDEEERLVANVFDRVAPAVVRINTGQSLGSGFLIDTSGHIVTNNHVIAGSNGQVRVSFTGLFETIGEVIGTDPDSDIAVLKVDDLPQGVTPVELGDSNRVRVGQRTIAYGNPLGQDRTITTGIISAIGRTIREEQSQYRIGGALQTDAAINPGNSGGPLLDSAGRVLGMNTAILSQSGTSSGIGFAVPVNLIKKIVPSLIERGSYDHPRLGVQLGDVTTLEAETNGLPSAGVLIDTSGISDSPVVRAGLNGQAILTAINNVPVTSSDQVIAYLELNTSPGDTVTLTLIDGNGQQRDVQVQLDARPRIEDRR